MLAAAAPLYDKDCARCHGGQAAATGPNAKLLPTQPANLTDTNLIKSASDGELFWKITNGLDPMPAFQQLSEKERRELVDYVRYLPNRSEYRYLGAHPKR